MAQRFKQLNLVCFSHKLESFTQMVVFTQVLKAMD